MDEIEVTTNHFIKTIQDEDWTDSPQPRQQKSGEQEAGGNIR